jgi:hypothetical protein
MRPQTRTISALSDDDNGIAESQTPSGAGNLTLAGALVSGGVATMAHAQILTITAAANESARTFTFTGTDADGRTISEAVTGPNATTGVTTKFFKTVTQIAVDAATAGALYVGPVATSGGVTTTIVTNRLSRDFQLAIAVVVPSGTLTYTVQHTLDDVQDHTIEPVWLDNSGLTGKTATDDGNVAFPITGLRNKLTAFTSGSAIMTALQN